MVTKSITTQETDILRLKAAYEAVDALDLDNYLPFLAEDVVFTFGNNPTATGRDAVREALEPFFAGLKKITHASKNTFIDGDTYVLEAGVTYITQDDAVVTVPATTIVKMNEGLQQEVRIFVDLAPLWATMQPAEN